ncbi:MAG TPA: cytosine permease [Streptosporangiaceae bacterium]|nr:cytosine permease [Streptosporangiaceae bacterium]
MTDTSSGTAPTAVIEAEVREGVYGSKVAAVEPGGAEFIPLADRHGKPYQQFLTWVSPNMEFATIFVGVIGVWFFGLSFWMATLAIVLGSAVGSVSMGFLAARGPLHGVPQMVLSRIGFGFLGNIFPAGVNSLVAGVGWFAVNSVSGAFALNALLHWPKALCLLIIVLLQIAVAFFGHNLVHVFERWSFPFLVVVFAIASIVILTKANFSAPSHPFTGGTLGGFLIIFGAAFGYAAGWNPYASDYTRYLPPDTDRRATGLWAALGVFLSCIALEIVGAASATITDSNKFGGNPTAGFTSHLATPLADVTLIAIALGAICANALNVYSGSMSFLALGVKLPLALRRAIVALVFGVAGFILALFGLHNAGDTYNNFLLVIAYWIGPWLGVFFADQYLRRGKRVDGFLFDRKHNPWGGVVAMVVATGVSIWLFANQIEYTGVVPAAHPAFGDITFEVGFVLAAVLYVAFFRFQPDSTKEETLHIPDRPAPATT